ncbi:hypothetical protein RB4832 [Rhodopirellula baltica SH 1]|uniref:Uncharacterized protein n=1 Tax=Rhodopirellula baltica (strain DSM 10527 / NCIMB 13988 / SH1) TaxID=243090 RepID=Q7UH54_RHOBA|nr:hypothetical protein RB4832 [Rhodopirellula baltica SH 1]
MALSCVLYLHALQNSQRRECSRSSTNRGGETDSMCPTFGKPSQLANLRTRPLRKSSMKCVCLKVCNLDDLQG